MIRKRLTQFSHGQCKARSHMFSEIAQPLTRLTKKSIWFNWSLDCQKAFDTLKVKLALPPVLAYRKDEGEYILDTNASNHAIGAVLSQI